MKKNYVLAAFASMFSLFAFAQNPGKQPPQIKSSIISESGSGQINYANDDAGGSSKTKTDCSPVLPTLEIPEVWFPFDGDFQDYSGNNYHGTNMNTTWTTDRYGNPGKALAFNGSNSGVKLNNGCPPVFQGSLTFSCWVYFNDDSRGILFGSFNTDHNVNFEKHTDFRLRIYWNNNERDLYTATGVVSAGSWYFVTFIRDVSAGSFRICVNGQEVETYSGTGSNITPAGPFYVGRDSRTGTTVLNGKMDDVRIYGRALSDTEVLALYNETDLVADFTAETTSGPTPLTVNFTDASVLNLAPIAEWKWYFGDGDSSSVQNPVHIYEHSGLDVQTYTVILKVKDENGFVSQMTKEDYIKVFPENYITGGNVSGTWTAADSPYFIGGEIIVPFGDTLTIEPGVCVKFRTNSIDYSVQEPTPDNSDFGYMTVYGTLIARGNEADSIVFTRAGNTGWWGMINLTNTANPENPIEYCRMEYASYMILDSENNDEIAGLSFDGVDGTVQNSSFYNNVIGIRCDSSNTEITNCRILNNTEHGIQCAYDTTVISGNTISGNGVHGIDCNQSYSTIMGNEIIDNTESGIYCYESDSIIVSGNTISGGSIGIWCHFSSGRIKNNTISLSSAYGIICYENSDPQIDNNIISNIDIAGIACGNDSDPQIDDNIISDINYYGIVCSNDSDPHVRNTFIRNTLYYCIYCMGSTNPEVINTTMVGTGGFVDCSPNSTCTIENSILWDFNNVATSGSGISITWSCVQGGYIGTGNISTNPMFTGTGEMPYALSWTNFPQNDATKSPCIDTGDPDPNGNGNDWLTDPDDRDPDQSRMDMGARYYHPEPAKELLNPNGVHQSFNFGPWDIGMISDYETFTITNKTACFTDCPVYLNKGGNSQFKMENLADTLLHFNPNETKNIGVAFLPTLTGPQYDTLNAGETGQFHDALRLIGTGQGTGNAEGIVLTSAGEGVPGVTITVTGGNIPSTHTTTTMADGSYYIANIGWGVFTITPSKYEDTIPHVFFPVHRTGTTSYPTYPTIENADFQDNSYFSVSGHIGYMNTTCPVEGVHILMDDEIEAVTDATGNFVIGSVEIGTHIFKPDTAGGHRFYPEQILDTILSPLAGMQFTDSLTYKLSGYVAGGGIPLPDSLGGGCSVPLADSVQLVVECMNSCGSAAVIYTDTLGYYSINLAPGQYEITPSPVVYNGTTITFDTRQVDLREGPVSGNFIYHTDPEIMISGFDTLPEFNGLKILEQFEIYNIAINIYEPYGDVQCPVTSGTVTVTDNLSDEGGEVDVPVSDSGAYYTFMAGYPNIYEPYKKDIRFEYENESGKIASFQQWVYITGQVPRETAFATTMPQIPLLILRDPPGDGSFSYMNNTTSVSNSYSFGTKHQDDTSAFVKASLCLKFKVKFLFGIKLDIEEKFSFKAGIEQSVRQNSITENQSTLTTSTTYKTSSDELIVGSGGDVYMGGAMNLLYGITDILSISGDSISVDQDIIFAPNGFATKYIYTEYQILNDIIPDLYRIEDFASAHRWENIIAYNQSLKDNAAPYMGNQSVSYGTTMQFFETMSRSRTHTEEFELMINKNMAAEIGLKINGLGLGEGAAVSSSITYGSSEVNSALNSTTVGFDVSDNDPLDIITYDIKTDRVYGTPVFETVSGETSCPYEEVTVPRQGCLLTIEPNVMWNVPAGEAALFEVNMINTSQTEEDLVPCILQSSNNPYGVNIKHETSLSLGKQFNLDYGSNVIYISVSMPEGGQIYDYEGLTLRLSPKCEKEIAEALGVVPDLSDAVTFDVHFDPPCSPISIQSPNNNWVVNQASNNILPVTITGYDTLNPDLHSVGLEYYSGGYWIEAFSILKESIQSPILNVDLDMSGFPDGECKIRAVVTCEGGEENYSENRTGIIDRISPMISGNPQPLDGILNIGDEIFFTFNEKLDVSSVTINSCKILDTYSGLTAGSSVQYISQGNKVLLTLNPENMYFLEGLLLKSQIAGVKDIYGNPLADTATWTFLVDQGPLHWNENNFVFIIEDGDSISFNSTLENVSSNDIFYWIDMPEWLTATPDTGTLYGVADSARINFVSQPLTGGIYYDTISAGSLGYPEEEIYITIQTAGGPELVVDPVSLEIQAAEGSTTFEISSNTTWTLDETTDWLSVNPVSGGGDAVITVYYDENTTGFVRNGGITITAAGGLLPLTVSVNQRVWLIHTVNLPKGWSGLSSYLMPGHDEIQGIYADIIDNLVIAVTEDAIYYPAENINTIGNWAPQSAYKVKTNMAVSLNISGEIEENRTLQLEEGWNLIPVISACPVDVESLFAPVVNDLVIVKEVAGYGVYWPEMGINNLGSLNPGEAYYVLMANSALLTFGECEKSSTLSSPGYGFGQNPVWNPVVKTAANHVIGIRGRAMLDFDPGDYIGVFTRKGICAGQIKIDELHKAGALVAFGNDALVAEKMGFNQGETLIFKHYQASTGMQNILIPEFEKSGVGINGKFIVNGLSVITGFKVTKADIPFDDESNIRIIPNPTTGRFLISGINENALLEVFDMRGQEVQCSIRKTHRGIEMDMTGMQSGVYVVKISDKASCEYKKLILR